MNKLKKIKMNKYYLDYLGQLESEAIHIMREVAASLNILLYYFQEVKIR